MTKGEAFTAFDKVNNYPIIVRNKRSKVRYHLARDIVECCTDNFVYGSFVTPKPSRIRRGGDIKWFDLKNVELDEKV